MMGRNHLVAGTAVGVGAMALLHRGTELEGYTGWDWSDLPGTLLGLIGSGADWAWSAMMPHGPVFWWIAAGLVLLWIGLLFPDIDSKNSMLGRYLPVHAWGPHHGFTHTDWLLWILFVMAIPEPTRLLIFLWLGALIHDEQDGFSTAGRVRFYPLQRHKIIYLGRGIPCVAVIRTRPIRYKVGKPSETVALIICLVLGGLGVLVGLT